MILSVSYAHAKFAFSVVMAFLLRVAALLLVAPLTTISAAGGLVSSERVACSKLKHRYPENTFFPGSSGYAYETQECRSCYLETRMNIG